MFIGLSAFPFSFCGKQLSANNLAVLLSVFANSSASNVDEEMFWGVQSSSEPRHHVACRAPGSGVSPKAQGYGLVVQGKARQSPVLHPGVICALG